MAISVSLPKADQDVSSPVSDGPLIDSPDAAARALCDFFLANADRGDNAVNDDLVAEMVRRIRIRQAASDSDA